MLYLNNWQRDLGRTGSLVLIVLFIFLFIFYEYILFSRLLAERYFDRALNYLDKAVSLGRDLIVKKSLFYQKALKSLKKAIGFNPYDAKLYFEYAQIISGIGEDSQLSSSLDVSSFNDKLAGTEISFCNVAKIKYTEAVLREPTNAIYHQRLATLYDKLSDYERTSEELKKAVLLDPQNVSIHLYISQYFLSKNKEKESLEHLNKLVELYKISLRKWGPGEYSVNLIRDFFKTVDREDMLDR